MRSVLIYPFHPFMHICSPTGVDMSFIYFCDIFYIKIYAFGLMRLSSTDFAILFFECFLLLLQMYAKAPQDHWKSKDTAIYLVTSLASKKQTSKVWYYRWDFHLYHILFRSVKTALQFILANIQYVCQHFTSFCF